MRNPSHRDLLVHIHPPNNLSLPAACSPPAWLQASTGHRGVVWVASEGCVPSFRDRQMAGGKQPASSIQPHQAGHGDSMSCSSEGLLQPWSTASDRDVSRPRPALTGKVTALSSDTWPRPSYNRWNNTWIPAS